MKLRISVLTIVFGLFSMQAVAQSARSDYNIQKSYKTQYADYQNRIKEVSSPDSAQALIAAIKEFDQKYSKHAKLLNRALYPDTYKQQIEKLKRSSVVAKERLTTIEQQSQKLEELESQLTGYEQDLQVLNRQTDSLKQAMKRSIQSEKQLSDMVQQYRKNLEKRDELIQVFIDSMVGTYQQMDLQALQDLENIDKKSRIESNGNVLKMIQDISAENLEILRKNTDKLRLEDYMRMSEVQQQFEKMWTGLGDKIQQVYDGDNAEQIASEITMNINKWGKVLNVQTFETLRDSLAANDINISGFQTSDELYASLNSYLDKKIQQSTESNSEAVYNDLKKFQNFWNRIEMRWSSNFANAGILSKRQMATINEKVDTWAENGQPKSNILVYLLGASVLLAVALGVMLVREKKSKHKS